MQVSNRTTLIPTKVLAVVNTHGYVDGYAGTRIDTWNGNLSYSRTDLTIPARGLPIGITMSYNLTRRGEERGFGNGWQLSYDMSYVESATNVFIRYGQGGESKFTWSGSSYTPPPGSQDTLIVDGAGYLLTTKYGTKYYLGDAGHDKITTIQNSQDDTLTFSYTGTDLTGVTDTHGRSITLAYSGGRLDTITDPNTSPARTIQYQYDGNGNLTKVTDPESNEIDYGYFAGGDGTYILESITDPNNNLFSISYDFVAPDKYFVNSISNGTDTISIEYFSRSLFRNIDYSVGVTVYKSTVHRYDNTGKLTQNNSEFKIWDSQNNVTGRTDENGNVTEYEYDANGNMTKELSPMVDGLIYSTIYSYESTFNRVESRTNANGNTTTYDYDAKGNLIKTTEPLGKITEYVFNVTDNQLYTEINPNGIITKYEYNSYGNRTRMTVDPSGLNLITDYTYDNVGNMTETIDPQNNTTTNTYDLLNRQTTVTNALSDDRIYSHDGIGNIVRETDERGKVTRYQYNSRNLQTKVIDALLYSTTSEYDFADNLVNKTDSRGNSTTYEYSYSICAACGTDRLVQVTDALTNSTVYSHDEVGNVIKTTDANDNDTHSEYDALNRQRTITNDVGDTTISIYDGVGNRTTLTNARGYDTIFTYDALNRVTTTTNALSDTTIYSHDLVGNVLKVTDAQGKITRYEYDNTNLKTKEIRVTSETDAETDYIYDDNGNLTSVTDPNSNATTYTYDDLNRQLTMSNALSEDEIYSYDPAGNRIKLTAANGNVTSYSYDDLNRITLVNDTIGTVAQNAYDGVGNKTAETSANNNITQVEYDALNRPQYIIDPASNTTTNVYDAMGNRTKVTDRDGKVAYYRFDDLNQLTLHNQKMTDTANSDDGDDILTRYGYDEVGNRTSITDSNANVTGYSYDEINLLLQETYADGTTRTLDYDAVGNVIERVDQNNNTLTNTYDDLHLLIFRDYPGTNDDTFTYDQGGRTVSAYNANITVVNSFDGINRLTQQIQGTETIGYTHNTANRTRVIDYPGVRQITETKDQRGRMDLVEDTAGATQTVANYSYDGNRLDAVDYLNGTTSKYSYNSRDWVTGLTHYTGGTTFSNFGYDFDNEGNRDYAERLHDTPNSEKYLYDDAARLDEFTRGTLDAGKEISATVTNTDYTLDELGNWTTKDVDGVPESRTHNEMNEIYSRDSTSLYYDNNGNLTDDDTNTYEYDYENRMVRAIRTSDGQTLVNYKYDAQGRRIEKEDVVNTITTSYYLDGGRVIEEQESVATTLTYVYGSGIDEVLQMDNGATYYYHPNSLGSIDALTDSSGNVQEYYRYDAYGEPSVYDSSWVYQGSSSGIDNPYLFTGRRLDDEIDLYYYRARYYSPTLGRFLQHDPLGYVDGMNLFEYVKGNPINYIDPYGLGIFSSCKSYNKWTTLISELNDAIDKVPPNTIELDLIDLRQTAQKKAYAAVKGIVLFLAKNVPGTSFTGPLPSTAKAAKKAVRKALKTLKKIIKEYADDATKKDCNKCNKCDTCEYNKALNNLDRILDELKEKKKK